MRHYDRLRQSTGRAPLGPPLESDVAESHRDSLDGGREAVTRPRSLDATAIGLSTLCVAHCLALPILASSLPLTGIWFQAEWVHWAFVAMAAPISILALNFSPQARPSPSLLILTLLGIMALVAGVLGGSDRAWETSFTIAGSLMLIGAHILNWRRRPSGGARRRAIVSSRKVA